MFVLSTIDWIENAQNDTGTKWAPLSRATQSFLEGTILYVPAFLVHTKNIRFNIYVLLYILIHAQVTVTLIKRNANLPFEFVVASAIF